jgi:hypothetical protein
MCPKDIDIWVEKMFEEIKKGREPRFFCKLKYYTNYRDILIVLTKVNDKFIAKEVHLLTGISKITVKKILEEFSEFQLIKMQGDGKNKFYTKNPKKINDAIIDVKRFKERKIY